VCMSKTAPNMKSATNIVLNITGAIMTSISIKATKTCPLMQKVADFQMHELHPDTKIPWVPFEIFISSRSISYVPVRSAGWITPKRMRELNIRSYSSSWVLRWHVTGKSDQDEGWNLVIRQFRRFRQFRQFRRFRQFRQFRQFCLTKIPIQKAEDQTIRESAKMWFDRLFGHFIIKDANLC
jgi:hypothetical protein